MYVCKKNKIANIVSFSLPMYQKLNIMIIFVKKKGGFIGRKNVLVKQTTSKSFFFFVKQHKLKDFKHLLSGNTRPGFLLWCFQKGLENVFGIGFILFDLGLLYKRIKAVQTEIFCKISIKTSYSFIY